MSFNVTIQGEGNNVGYPCFLYRLTGCNLKCPWCDTKYAQKQTNSYKMKDFINEFNKQINIFPFIKKIIITGGEPFLNNESVEHIYNVVSFLNNAYEFENIEFETNGTNLINIDGIHKRLLKHSNISFNISPKLNMLCFPDDSINFEKIYKDNLEFLLNETDNYFIKFVYKFDEELINENIFKFISLNNIPTNKIIIMPFTPNKKSENFNDDYKTNCLNTLKFCLQTGFRYSPRIQVDLNIV